MFAWYFETRDILRNVERSVSVKSTQSQWHKKSVLNPHSPEVWRKTAEEREFWVSSPQQGAEVCLRTPAELGNFYGLVSKRRILARWELAEGEELESNILQRSTIVNQGPPPAGCGHPPKRCQDQTPPCN
jgi:hypothetical protein